MNLEDYRRGLAEYPPPWKHYLVAENVSAVIAPDNGRLVAGSMIYGGTRAETEVHALIVAAVNYVTGNAISSCSYTDDEKKIKELEKTLDDLLAAVDNLETWEGLSIIDMATAAKKAREALGCATKNVSLRGTSNCPGGGGTPSASKSGLPA